MKNDICYFLVMFFNLSQLLYIFIHSGVILIQSEHPVPKFPG